MQDEISGGVEPDAARVSEVEHAAAMTWPASTVQHRGGWLLRYCADLDRWRSNSALPPSRVRDVAAEIEQVVRFYSERGARASVQVSPSRWHEELDVGLAARGFRQVTPVHVLTAELPGPGDVSAAGVEVRLDDEPMRRWLDASSAVRGRSEPGLARIDRPARYATALLDGVAAGIGLFVREGRWCAVYCMATAPWARGRGVARAVLRAGARWAGEVRASGMFLQVEQDNDAARRLYAGCGFEFSHEYHYRVADTRG